MGNDSKYWDIVFIKILKITGSRRNIYWSRYITSHKTLIYRFLKDKREFSLKTDGFEEAIFPNDYIVTKDLRKKNKMVIIDISKKVIKYAKKNGHAYYYVVGSVSVLPFKSSSFSSIVSASTIDNIDKNKITSSIIEMLRVMSNRSILILTFDNPYNVFYRFEHEFLWRIIPIYKSNSFINPKDVKKILKNMGFYLCDYGSIVYIPPILDKMLLLLEIISFVRIPNSLIDKIILVYKKFLEQLTKYHDIIGGRFIYMIVCKK